jgi:hypothetical protein
VEDRSVERDDARRLLAAVLQGVEPERRDGGGIRMPVDAEDAAFFTQGIAVEVQVHLFRGDLPRLRQSRHRSILGIRASTGAGPYLVGLGPNANGYCDAVGNVKRNAQLRR